VAILKCDDILEGSRKITLLVSHSTLEVVDCEKREGLDRFFNTLTTSLPDFSAARFFSIGRSTILSIFGTVTSFLVVLVTFDPDQPGCVVKTNISEIQ
jgi:hypothetical protein